MTRLAGAKPAGYRSSLGTEFDDFLLAPIGEDNNGMQLSVLSALARLDVDPWEQAAELARLPRDTAVRQLASMLAVLPPGPSVRAEPAMIAARLVALLPRPAAPEMPLRPTLPGVGTVTRSPILTYLMLYAIFMLFMLACRWLVGGAQAPAQTGSVPATPAGITAPQSPAPIAGQ
jgi:hypothetical protein